MSAAVLAWAASLEQAGPAVWTRTSTWAYPSIEIVHLLGLALLVGSAVAFDLRLLGVSPRLPVDAMARHLLPWARVGFALMVASGFLLFSADATTYVRQPVFFVKLSAIGLGVVNATVFRYSVFRTVSAWNDGPALPLAARRTAVVSLLSWTTAIVCGRLLAYF